MRLRVARKIVKRCRLERARRGLSDDYTRCPDGLAPYRRHTVAVALRRISKATKPMRIFLEGLHKRQVY